MIETWRPSVESALHGSGEAGYLFKIFFEPRPLGAEVNRGLYSIESRLSPDGRTLYFSSVWAPKPVDFGGVESGKRALERSEWETGLLNIWSVPLAEWTLGKFSDLKINM